MSARRMHPTRRRVLLTLAARDGSPVTANELAEEFKLGATAIGVQLRELATLGLVRTVAGPRRSNTGRRPAGWVLTAAGRWKADALAREPQPVIQPLVRDLQRAREERRLSGTRIAQAAGLGPNTVNQWESGGRSPRLDQLTRYAEALGYQIVLLPISKEP